MSYFLKGTILNLPIILIILKSVKHSNDKIDYQINVNGRVKIAITQAVDEPYLEMFDEAQKWVIQLMRDGPYTRFIDEENLKDILKGHG